MKKIIIAVITLFAFVAVSQAQSGQATGKRQHKPLRSATTAPVVQANSGQSSGNRQPGTVNTERDSFNRKVTVRPVAKPANTNTPAANKTKLDDLKNPFDTNKVKKPAAQRVQNGNN